MAVYPTSVLFRAINVRGSYSGSALTRVVTKSMILVQSLLIQSCSKDEFEKL